MNKIVIGSIECVSLPKLELFNLDAKIDTGAENCAIHADILNVNDGMITFCLVDDIHPSYKGLIFTLPIYRLGYVKSSNGKRKKRYFIILDIKIFDKTIQSEISIADRSKMKYPMLVGKRFLENGFLVDVSQMYLSKE